MSLTMQKIDKALRPHLEADEELEITQGSKGDFQVLVYHDENKAKRTEAEFAEAARLVGLPEDCFGKSIKLGRSLFRITGVNLRAPKNPVQMTHTRTGTQYKASVSHVLSGLRS